MLGAVMMTGIVQVVTIVLDIVVYTAVIVIILVVMMTGTVLGVITALLMELVYTVVGQQTDVMIVGIVLADIIVLEAAASIAELVHIHGVEAIMIIVDLVANINASNHAQADAQHNAVLQ